MSPVVNPFGDFKSWRIEILPFFNYVPFKESRDERRLLQRRSSPATRSNFPTLAVPGGPSVQLPSLRSRSPRRQVQLVRRHQGQKSALATHGPLGRGFPAVNVRPIGEEIDRESRSRKLRADLQVFEAVEADRM